MEKLGKIGAIIGIIFIIFLITYMGTLLITSFKVEADCLKLGWRNSIVVWNFEQYCIREENEYEITKPLKELK